MEKLKHQIEQKIATLQDCQTMLTEPDLVAFLAGELLGLQIALDYIKHKDKL